MWYFRFFVRRWGLDTATELTELSLGAENVPFWLLSRGADLREPRLFLDRAWRSSDGSLRRELNLGDLLDCIAAFRHMYRTIGVKGGSVVLLRMANPVDVYLHWIALAAEGAIAAPLNPNLSPDLLPLLMEKCDAFGLVAALPEGPEDAGELRSFTWLPGPQGGTASATTLRADGKIPADEESWRHAPDEVALLCHTSGTTGVPKLVSITHRSLIAGIRNQLGQAGSPLLGGLMVNALPPAHASSLSTITWSLLGGAKLILASDQSAETLVQIVDEFRPQSITSFSCTLRDVAALGLAEGALESVGLWMTTGDASRRHDIEAVTALGSRPGVSGGARREPGMYVLDCFGSSELGHMHFSILHLRGQFYEPRCIGRPAGFVEAAILDENGNEMPAGEVGLLAVCSDSITAGYWNDPERTEASRKGRYWLTGDVGYRDRFGRYFQLDRSSDVIRRDDGPVYSVPTEEAVLRALPEVKACAVVGRVLPGGAVDVVGILEVAEPRPPSEVWLSLVNTALSNARLPQLDEIELRSPGELPFGPTGKIRKFLLRQDNR